MSETTETRHDELIHDDEQAYPTTPPEAGEHHHPSDFTYIKVALILAVMTTLEVLTYPFDFGHFAVPLLLILMTLKFGTVVAYFMHLKFDSIMFRRLFIAGIITAVVVYSAALTMFHFWGD